MKHAKILILNERDKKKRSLTPLFQLGTRAIDEQRIPCVYVKIEKPAKKASQIEKLKGK